MSKNKVINDAFNMKDGISPGIWGRTEILVGSGEVLDHLTPGKKAHFAPGCPFTKSKNMVVLGGTQYVMERLFGVSNSNIAIPTMYSENGIGLPDSTPSTSTYITPVGRVAEIYRPGNLITTFGVGITGTGENDVTVYPVDYREKSINISRVGSDGIEVNGTMLPFRYTDESLPEEEKKMYFGKKTDENGYTGYYLKRFEAYPVIKHVWKTGQELEDEREVASTDVWENINGLNAVETFTEIVLKIDKADIKEYFISLEQEARTRINTIALFTGEFVKDDSDESDYGDYRDVRLFSKLCINTEYLTLAKNLNIIYRVYSA